MKRISILITLLFIAWNAKSQGIVPAEIPVLGRVLFMQEKNGVLYVVYAQEARNGNINCTVIERSSNSMKWFQYPPLFLNRTAAIHDIVYFENKLCLAGKFTVGSIQLKNNFVYFNGSSWQVPYQFLTNNALPGNIKSLAIAKNKLIIAGEFSTCNGIVANNIVKVESQFSGIATFSKNTIVGSNGSINSIVADSTGNSLLLFGSFTAIVGQNISYCAAYTIGDSVFQSSYKVEAPVYKALAKNKRILIQVQEKGKTDTVLQFLVLREFEKIENISSILRVNNMFIFDNRIHFVALCNFEGREREGIFTFLNDSNVKLVFPFINKIGFADIIANQIYLAGRLDIEGNELLDPNYLYKLLPNIIRFNARLFWDKNGNEVFNPAAGELGLANRMVRIKPGNQIVYTNEKGILSCNVEKGRNITLEILGRNPIQSGTVNIVTPDSFQFKLYDFPVAFKNGNTLTDLRINITSFTGQKALRDTTIFYRISVFNDGVVKTNSTVKVKVENKSANIIANPLPASVVGNEIIWNVNDLAPNSSSLFTVQLRLNKSDFSENQNIQVIASATAAGDAIAQNNVDTLLQQTQSGIPAFVKLQSISGNSSTGIGEITPNIGKMDYTIRFTNNTMDTIFNVRVVDTIAIPDYVIGITETGSSHNFTRSLYTHPSLPNKLVATYTFSNIKLPPNPSANPEIVTSSGYIALRLDLQQNLTPGVQMSNRAQLFMDNLTPMFSNTVLATVVSTNSLQNNITSQTVQLYPNPSNGKITIITKESLKEIKILDIQGKIIYQKNNLLSLNQKLDIIGLPSGIYIAQIQEKNGNWSNIKFIKN